MRNFKKYSFSSSAIRILDITKDTTKYLKRNTELLQQVHNIQSLEVRGLCLMKFSGDKCFIGTFHQA